MRLVCVVEPFKAEQTIFLVEDTVSMQPLGAVALDNFNETILNYSDMYNVPNIDICGTAEEYIKELANQLQEDAVLKYGAETNKNIGVLVI